jgi:hypothetical protein
LNGTAGPAASELARCLEVTLARAFAVLDKTNVCIAFGGVNFNLHHQDVIDSSRFIFDTLHLSRFGQDLPFPYTIGSVISFAVLLW